MSPITLFRTALFPPKPFEAETERQFLCNYSTRHVTRRRVVGIVALCVCLAYLGIDIVDALSNKQFMPIFTHIILPLRLLGTAALAASAWLSFSPLLKTSERYANFCGTCGILSAYLMLLALTSAKPFPGHYLYYYDGILLVFLYLCGILRLLAKPTLMLVSVMLALTFLTFITDGNTVSLSNLELHSDVDHDTPLSFMVIFAIICYLITLEQEHTARYTFMREQDLQQTQAAIKNSTEAIVMLTEQAHVQAEQQNRDKSKFIANAAHDLRNVMQPSEIFLDLTNKALARNDLPKAQDYVSAAITANKALRIDINALLDISELDSGIIKVQYSNFDARTLADEVLKENSLFANECKIKLHLANKTALTAVVHSDRHQLKRILTNLVVNAIKYADPAKGEAAKVVIAIVSHAQTVRIDVLDNGIGIPHSEQENIFNPLYQLNNPERDREKGKGLGLSIVKTTLNLLSQHTLKLISKPGVGSRFSLKLPKGDSIVPASPLPAHDLDISISGLYVLIVENDPLVQQSLLALLKNQGAEIDAVGSMAGLQRLLPNLERDPDIVISDYRLNANFTAKDVINVVNNHFGYDLPSLILTGETADLSQKLPGRIILHKPIETKHLLTEIHRLTQA
jgi:two-component system, sensor histidine kinase